MVQIITLGLFAIMAVLSGLLTFEYFGLKQRVSHIAQLEQEYETYTAAFRKIVSDYRLKESDDDAPSDGDGEKKKEQQFLVVNREASYLRAATNNYFKKQRLGFLLDRLSVEDRAVRTRPSRLRRRAAAAKRERPRYRSLVLAQLARRRMEMARAGSQERDIHFIWPIDQAHFWLSSFYGPRRKPDRSWGFHYGIDLAAIKGTAMMAAADGVVIEAGMHKGYGNTIVIMHNKKYKTRYAHLQRIYVHVGQQVSAGHCIGTVGDTGLVRKRGKYASHLHLEVYSYGHRVNPLYFFVN